MDVFLWNARARNGHVEATLNHPFPAQVDDKIKAAGFHEGATYFELGAFATAAAHGLDVPVSVRDGTMAVAMGVAAHKSLAERRKVDLAEVLPGYAKHLFLRNGCRKC